MFKVFTTVSEKDLTSILDSMEASNYELVNILIKHDMYISQDRYIIIAKEKEREVY